MNFFNKPQKPLSPDIVHIRLNYNSIRVVDFEEAGRHLFIEVTRKTGNTMLDFSNAGNYRAYCYNAAGHLDTQHLAFHNHKSSFIVGTKYKSILLWRQDHLMSSELNSKKFKYLDYIPKPMHLENGSIDFVNDEEFVQKDERIPLLMLTQHGIFPGKKNYGVKPIYDYRLLDGLEDRLVGFVGRGYLSNRERKGIIFKHTGPELMKQITADAKSIDLDWWA
ncbi:hypothetical protein LB450_00955 [Psychroflexus sp. CAK1W]|uniref:hypothetical protein n=1 Tax=Psychroflexus curvus TaxID=2873595 RepID=UPI001CCDC6B1|nr:hypothetical protein [Psychroflexus curvus]MBZ9626658.1 hypothetical protein [Psychroflexus curvus]